MKLVAKMLKAVHAQESKKAAREKAKAVVEELRSMKLKEAAKKVEDGIEETLTYCDFPSEHWTRIRTNNVIERLNREIRRRTRVVGSFPDGNPLLADFTHARPCKPFCEKYLTLPTQTVVACFPVPLLSQNQKHPFRNKAERVLFLYRSGQPSSSPSLPPTP